VIAAGLQALDLLLLAGALLLVVEAGLRRLGRLLDAQRGLCAQRTGEGSLDRSLRSSAQTTARSVSH